VVRLSSTLDVLRALRNGNLQGAGLTLDETLTLIDEGIDLQIVLVVDYSNGADVVMATPAVDSLQALKGKRIGVEMNAVGATLLRSMLNKAGLSLNDVLVESMPISHLAHACTAQRIEVAVAYQPYAGELTKCGMKPLFTSAEIPGKIVDLLVVRRDALHQQDQMHQLLEGYFKALQHIADQPTSSQQQMAENLGISVADVQRDSQSLREQGVIRKQVDILQHLDNRWLPEAAL
jgi:NitT/TauT family transport system substrate-binding protein